MKHESPLDFIDNAPIGYARHRIVTNTDNVPCDFVFLRVNRAYCTATGLVAEDIIGKRITDVLPDIRKDSFNWIEYYGALALSGGSIETVVPYRGGLGRTDVL